MKKTGVIVVGLLIGFSIFIITCGKDPNSSQNQAAPNQPPVAKAGKDTSITLVPCNRTGYLKLDGSGSYDPDNNPLSYSWVVLSPTNSGIGFSDSRSATPTISLGNIGQYIIELTVRDPGNLFAKDTLIINVFSSATSGFDLDININARFIFWDNYLDCYYYNPCIYYDLSYTDLGNGLFLPLGSFNFYLYEEADTSATSDVHTTHMGLYTGNSMNSVSVNGTTSVNFKRVFQNGGGAFSGTFTPINGSALNCDKDIFKNIAPLTVTGTLNITTSSLELNIKGKIYF